MLLFENVQQVHIKLYDTGICVLETAAKLCPSNRKQHGIYQVLSVV